MFYVVGGGRGYAAAARGLPWLEQYPVGHGLSASRRLPQRCPHDPSDGNAGKDAVEHHGGRRDALLQHAVEVEPRRNPPPGDRSGDYGLVDGWAGAPFRRACTASRIAGAMGGNGGPAGEKPATPSRKSGSTPRCWRAPPTKSANSGSQPV